MIMKHLYYLTCLITIACQFCSVNGYAQAASSPFQVGLVGSISRQFPTGRLAAVQDIQRFPAILDIHNGTAFEGGIEAIYRLNPSWELALRGEYGQSVSTTSGEEHSIVSVWNPQASRYQPVPATIQNTLTANVNLLSFTPLVRLYLGDIFFVSLGSRFDVPLQSSLRYRFDIADPATFVSNFSQRIDTALRLPPPARVGFSWSPTLSVGASLTVNRVRFMPEIQVQPLFQPFRGFTPENTPWNLASVRFNLAIVLSFPPPKADEPLSSSAPPKSVPPTALESSIPPTLQTNNANQTNTANSLQPTKDDASSAQDSPILFPMRLDTVFQRDTTTQVVAWNRSDTVRVTGKTTQSISIPSGKQIMIAESYIHDVPKPKPFLVANLDVRFIPALGAARTTETKQAARLVEKPMIIRSLTSDATSGAFALKEKYDTLNAVRMPLMRFLPTISSEIGVRERCIAIGSEHSPDAPLLTIIAPDAKPLDWDAQTLLFAPSSQSRVNTLIGDTLAVWMTVADNEGQRVKTDIARITVENLDTVSPYQATAPMPRQPGRWMLVSMRVVVGDSLTGQLILAPEALRLREYVIEEVARRKARAKAGLKNCTVYGEVPFADDVTMLAQVRALTQNLAEALKTSSVYVALPANSRLSSAHRASSPDVQHFDKKTYAFPRTDAYIRVMIEE